MKKVILFIFAATITGNILCMNIGLRRLATSGLRFISHDNTKAGTPPAVRAELLRLKSIFVICDALPICNHSGVCQCAALADVLTEEEVREARRLANEAITSYNPVPGC